MRITRRTASGKPARDRKLIASVLDIAVTRK
jgi:hypothetical protein